MFIYEEISDALVAIKNAGYMLFTLGPFIFALLILCWLMIVRYARDYIRELLNMVEQVILSLKYLFGLEQRPPGPQASFIEQSFIRFTSFSHDKTRDVLLRRTPPRAGILRNIFIPNALAGTPYANNTYLAYNPANKEENLSKALVHFLYNRLRTEAMSQTLANPAGNFDLLAECPNLAAIQGLEGFPEDFKCIKDLAMKHILQPTRNANNLSVIQCYLMIELIKAIIIKKAYERMGLIIPQGCRRDQFDNLINKMPNNDFISTDLDTRRFICMSLNIGIDVLRPGNKINNLYNNHLIIPQYPFPPPFAPPPTTMTLLEQEEGSYTLIR